MAIPRTFIIGVDFGTTYTGVAIACSDAPEEISTITNWPGSNGITSDKVPTEFSYKCFDADLPIEVLSSDRLNTVKEPVDHDTFKDIYWGYQVKPGSRTVKYIKLLLDRELDFPSVFSPADLRAQLTAAERDPQMATTDFLKKVTDHILHTLDIRFGKKIVQTTPMKFILTVPAIWSDVAKQATLTAARKAGMGNDLRLISEPEAAAVWTMKSLQPRQLNVDDHIVVCDAGGGTVDLITYKILNPTPLELEESQVGSGGLCGSTFLDHGFIHYLESKFGKKRLQSIRSSKPRTWQNAMKYFDEYVKRNFAVDTIDEYNIPFTDVKNSRAAGLEDGYLVLSSEEVRKIFEPVVNQIITLVEGQVNGARRQGGTVAAIVLVGGFGQSSYLHSMLKNHFQNQSTGLIKEELKDPLLLQNSPFIEVINPPNSWAAICRGAVLRGLEGSMIMSRRTRYHYGCRVNDEFDASIHPDSHKYWDSPKEHYKARDCMRWFLKKNEAVSQERVVKIELYHASLGAKIPRGTARVRRCELYIACEDTAPFLHGPTVRKICTLMVDLTEVPDRNWKLNKNSKGLVYRQLNYFCTLKVDSATMVFGLFVDGKERGSVSVAWED